jgi:hypothetical protein
MDAADRLKRPRPVGRWCLALGAATLFATSLGSLAQTPAPRTPVSSTVPKAAPEVGLKWSQLNASQRASLVPLEKSWSGIDAPRKDKWLEIASRMPRMAPDERERMQTRMAEWAQLSPEQRGRVRMNFLEAKQAAPEDRKAQWDAYQALPVEQKQQLAARAAPAASRAAAKADDKARDNTQTKSNIVPNPSFAERPRPVAPTIMQAQPGATTTLMSKRPTPPPHQQTGLPKIAATPQFVDKATLLPQRGPQGAAARSAAVTPAPDDQP